MSETILGSSARDTQSSGLPDGGTLDHLSAEERSHRLHMGIGAFTAKMDSRKGKGEYGLRPKGKLRRILGV